MEIKYNDEEGCWEVYSRDSVVRNGVAMPVYVSADLNDAVDYVTEDEGWV